MRQWTKLYGNSTS